MVASVEGRPEAEQTQKQFPHLIVVADSDATLAAAAEVVHQGPSTGGRVSAAPTTVLIERGGIVRWLYRPERHINRLTPAELLAAIDSHLNAAR